ncbi:MAG: Trm112 family protein [Rickettsiaceae bacterium H1]|nr:Trm112 family protein [Rickettsiaceae bacterium H1]
MLDENLLKVLVCPVTKGPLIYNRKDSELISKAAGLAFPIRDDIPIMLVEEARTLEND